MEQNHDHGKNCGHLAIAHINQEGRVHVGFLAENGEISCFSNTDGPSDTLQDLCFKSERGTLCMHVKGFACQNNSLDCWKEAEKQFLLTKSNDVCNISSWRSLSPPKEAENHEICQNEKLIRHDQHLDHLVRSSGEMKIHCSDGDKTSSCLIRETLRPVYYEVKDNDIKNGEDWVDLFIVPNQTVTSVVKVTNGLCCKSEISKLEQVLSKLENLLKTEVDLKSKTIRIWHGAEKQSDWAVSTCEALKSVNFGTEIKKIGGNLVTTSLWSVKQRTIREIEDILKTNPRVLVSMKAEKLETIKIQHFENDHLIVIKEVYSQLLNHSIENRLLSIGNKAVSLRYLSILNIGNQNIDELENMLNENIRDLLFCKVLPTRDGTIVLYFYESMISVVDSVSKYLTDKGFNIMIPNDQPEGKKLLEPRPILDGSTMVRSILSVAGVCCQSEVPSVVSCCKQLEGVNDVNVSIISKQVFILHDPLNKDIPDMAAKCLNDNGFPTFVLIHGSEGKKIDSNLKPKINKIPWYVILATFLWGISWLSYFVVDEFKYLSIVACTFGLPRIAFKGIKSFQRRIMDVNILMTVAVIGALFLQDFHEAASVTVIFSWSDWLEDRASTRAKAALQTLLDLKPEIARTVEGVQIPVDSVTIGQKLIVRSGDKVPVDGILISNHNVDLDESNLTGESRPVIKQTGDFLNAGTLNVSSTWFLMKCTAISQDSAISRMIQLVEETSSSRSPTELFVERVAKFYTPIIVSCSFLLAVIPLLFFPNADHNYWIHSSLTLLVVSCPCALIISTPITYVCAQAQCARFGVLVKGGKYLEILAKVNRIACDKTGTLTQAKFSVNECRYFENKEITELESIVLLKSIEQNATHPIAIALQNYCENYLKNHKGSIHDEDSSDDEDCHHHDQFDTEECQLNEKQKQEVEIIPGEGVRANVGSARIVYVVKNSTRLNLCDKNEDADLWFREKLKNGDTVSWLILNQTLGLGIAASDQVRPSAREAIATLLNELRIPVTVLTGDNEGAALGLKNQIPEIDQVFSKLSPKDKVNHIQEMKIKNDEIVAMIGDGVNDAPALTCADVGIAMGVSGSPLALETADCALMDNDLRKIPRLIKLAKRTRTKVIQNVVFSLLLKMVMLGLTFAGLVTLGIAIAVDVFSMLLVTLNGVALLEGSSTTEQFVTEPEVSEDGYTRLV